VQLVFGPHPWSLCTYLTDDFGTEARIVSEFDANDTEVQIKVSDHTFFAAVHFTQEGLW
jgi:hypothetical protein